MNSKRVWRLLLEINEKGLSKDLRVYKLGAWLDKNRRVSKKKEKLKVLIIKVPS